MLYCPNPDCDDRENSSEKAECQACGTNLLLQGRYQVIQLLCQRQYAATELFKVIDLENASDPVILKTLVSQDDKVAALFEREQQLLNQIVHEGMPRGYAAFPLALASGRQIQCLVMEYIPGENLEQWMHRQRVIFPDTSGAITQSQAIDWLKQLLHTLDYLHQQKVFHRDIKPSNIMRKPDGKLVLIDFGSTRQITETVLSNRTRTAVVSFGYTAPEQISGKAVPQSDIYALGKTLMHLLMGDCSNELSFIPRQPISPAFHRLLRDMTAASVRDRPATVKMIRKRLQKIERAAMRRRWQQIGGGFGAGLVCGGLVMIPLVRQINWEFERDRLFPKSACDQQLNDRISCGEESLLNESALEALFGNQATQVAEIRRDGIQSFRDRQWESAKAALQTVWNQTRDPEALVYLNNLKIQTDPKLYQQKTSIAVVIPVGGNQAAITRGLSILRGVAQAQDQAVKSGLGLQVILVDDQNDARIARQLAQELVRRQTILAVLGHHVSDATLAALDVYDQAGMVLISPTSTSEELATYTLKQNNIFFRTVPTDRATATYMASFLLNQTRARTVAVFYNPDKSYSRSLAGAFKETFQALQGKIINDPQGQFYLSCAGIACQRSPLQVNSAISYAKGQGAEAFVVLPDASESQSNAFTDAVAIIKATGPDWVITGDTMAGEPQLLAAPMVGRTIIASTGNSGAVPDSILNKFWQSPTDAPQQPISWHAYTAYNATQVALSAIKQRQGQHIDRALLREQIAAPNFAAVGASGPIRFRDGTGEMQTFDIMLTNILKCKSSDGTDLIRFQSISQPNCSVR